jgi:hypothetical protein
MGGKELRCAKIDSKCMERKRRRRGTHRQLGREVWRPKEEIDAGLAAALRAPVVAALHG